MTIHFWTTQGTYQSWHLLFTCLLPPPSLLRYQDAHKRYFEPITGKWKKFPDTSNPCYQSYSEAAAELITYRKEYIDLLTTLLPPPSSYSATVTLWPKVFLKPKWVKWNSHRTCHNPNGLAWGRVDSELVCVGTIRSWQTFCPWGTSAQDVVVPSTSPTSNLLSVYTSLSCLLLKKKWMWLQGPSNCFRYTLLVYSCLSAAR
jgi:hypothetical protein